MGNAGCSQSSGTCGSTHTASCTGTSHSIPTLFCNFRSDPTLASRLDLAESELGAELWQLNIKQLRERALAAGVSGDAVEEARDADDPKAELISLLVARDAKSLSAADLSAAQSDDERPPAHMATTKRKVCPSFDSCLPIQCRTAELPFSWYRF